MSNADRIRSINDPGWDGVNSTVAQLQLKTKDDLDIKFKRCFDTEAGKEVLKHLRSITLDQPCWVPGADASFGYSREGQNSIIREIEQRIKRANE